jgi:Chromo (CHRromatin Organisation MOdifier) domain
MLEPSTPNTFSGCKPTPDPLVFIDGEPEYEISEIWDSRIDKRRKCKLLYLVRWTGYEGTDEETSWLPASELRHVDEVVVDFHDAYPAKPGPLSMLEVTH